MNLVGALGQFPQVLFVDHLVAGAIVFAGQFLAQGQQPFKDVKLVFGEAVFVFFLDIGVVVDVGKGQPIDVGVLLADPIGDVVILHFLIQGLV